MDVKDVARRVYKDALSPISLQQAVRSKPAAEGPKVREVRPEQASTTSTEESVDISSLPAGLESEVRKGLNEAISSINIASDATNSIGKYLSTIDGFIEQAQSKDITPQRQQALESEANQLVEEIKRTAQQLSHTASASLGTDDVRKEIEAKIGKALDVLLPDDSSNSVGIGPISFSRKESIIQTIANVTAARQRIEETRKAVQESGESLKTALLSIEVAEQNGESSNSSIRDVEAAAQLASETQSNIFKNPEGALNSVGNIVVRSLELLK